MTATRRLARPLIATSFVTTGLDAVRHPGPRAEAARPLLDRLAALSPDRVPADPEVLVRAGGAAMAGAGALYGLGRLPRLSAAVMALTLLPSTYTQHAFWTEKEPQARRAQRQHFLKNVSLVGAALLAAVDTAGRPGLAWRGEHAVRDARRRLRRARRRPASPLA